MNHIKLHNFSESELIIGLVGGVGINWSEIINCIKMRLKKFKYIANPIRISSDVISKISPKIINGDDEYERISSYMTAGNDARKYFNDNSILALGAASIINTMRDKQEPIKNKTAFIINQLKHPDEVARLREIYSEGFYLIGVHEDRDERIKYLEEILGISPNNAIQLVDRDEDEPLVYGQQTRDTFQLADFFIHYQRENVAQTENDIFRVLDLLFGSPYATPTFDEYAMFMAFSASTRSADLSRQVGAVITKNCEIIATGANDCPKFSGGLYWPERIHNKVVDIEKGRDYKRGFDSNQRQKNIIIDDIIGIINECVNEFDKEKINELLQRSKLCDITEYGRVVHAEMEAILSCARNTVSTKNAVLYCTTFPCHNCAKHIIASGIKKVVYIEPYPKSKAIEFHDESISQGFSCDINKEQRVQFEPFVGVGPRRFIDLYSMRLSRGYPLIRKQNDGSIVKWERSKATLRLQNLPFSYLEREENAFMLFQTYRERC